MGHVNDSISADDRRRVAAFADVLASGCAVREGPGGWPEYANGLTEGLWFCRDLTGQDRNYLDNMKDVHRVAIRDLSWEQLGTWFTSISRGERFCTGHIAASVEDGTLANLVERLQELLGEK